jgi:hypothetical protein
MCIDCVLSVRPDRGSTCLETGQYLLNYKCCHKCGKRGALQATNTGGAEEDNSDDGSYEETVTFDHTCKDCGHVICEHFYKFEVQGNRQDYMMDCVLCGKATHTTLIDVSDDEASAAGGAEGDPSVNVDTGNIFEPPRGLSEAVTTGLSAQIKVTEAPPADADSDDNDWDD